MCKLWRWASVHVHTGLWFNRPLLDDYMVKDEEMQSLVGELDLRGDQEQPLTA